MEIMTGYLRKLVEYFMRPKMSTSIVLGSKSTSIETIYRVPIQLDPNKSYEMALVNLETYYSFPNVDSTNNNFRYSPNNGTTWVDIAIPEGSYEIESLNNEIQRVMKANGHYNTADKQYIISISPNLSTLKSILGIQNANYKVDFTTPNSIRTMLGFNSQVYGVGEYDSPNIVDILRVTSIRITCDIIGGSYINGSTSNVIYSFFPSEGPGEKVLEKPVNLVYLPVSVTGEITHINTQMVDQNGRLLNLRGEDLNIRFHMRER